MADEGHQIISMKFNAWNARNGLDRRNQITAKNRQDSADERNGLFVTRVGELDMYSKILTRSLHANKIRISSSTSQTTHDAKKAEIILNTPVIVSYNEGMKYLLKIQEAVT